MFGRWIRCCCWMPGMAIPAGAAAAAAGSGGSSSSRCTPVLGPCWGSLPSSSPKCSGFRGWNAWPHIAVSTGLLFHSVKSWVFCYLDIFLTSPETLRALIYYLHSFPVSFGWSYNSHFVSEKISTSSLKVLLSFIVFSEALRIKSRHLHPQAAAFLLTAAYPLHSHCWLSTCVWPLEN